MNRNFRIVLTTLTLAAVYILSNAGAAFSRTPDQPSNAAQAFEKLKTLVGNWEAITPKGKVTTTFELASKGTVLLEHMNVAGQKDMITAYYVDGDRLLLTHYCDTGNQPRMQATSFDPESQTIDFHFVDVTNLSGPNAQHMHDVSIKFNGPNEVAADWTAFKDGKAGFTVPFRYHRVN